LYRYTGVGLKDSSAASMASYGKDAQQAADTLAATKAGTFAPSFSEETASAIDGKKDHGHLRHKMEHEEQKAFKKAAPSASSPTGSAHSSMTSGIKKFLSTQQKENPKEPGRFDSNLVSLLNKGW
jgi:hypothetical protein